MPTGSRPRGAARLAAQFGEDWLHLTTRQNLELHWVARPRRAGAARPDRRVRPVDALGLRAHGAQRDGVRGRRRRAGRAVRLPARRPHGLRRPDRPVGGAQRHAAGPAEHRPRGLAALPPRRAGQRHRPRVDGRGRRRRLRGVGRRQPRQGAVKLAVLLAPFVPRTDVLAAVEAVVDVFVAHGSFDEPAKGRLKFVDRADRRRRASGRRGRRRSPRPPTGTAPGRRRRRAAWPRSTTPRSSPRARRAAGAPACDRSAVPGHGVGDDRRPARRHHVATRWSCSAISPTATPTAS